MIGKRWDAVLRRRPTFSITTKLAYLYIRLVIFKRAIYFAENITNDRAEDHQYSKNNNGYQNKNQRVLYQTLAFLFRGEQHEKTPPFFDNFFSLVTEDNYIINISPKKTRG